MSSAPPPAGGWAAPGAVAPASAPPQYEQPGLAPGAPAGATGGRRPGQNAILTGLVVLLALALIGTGVAIGVTRSHLRHQVSTLDREAHAREQARAQERARLVTDFQQADLNGKLQRVRELTAAAERALLAWASNGSDSDTIKVVRFAQNTCDAAVIEYDATAARFPADLLAGLPTRIDINDSATDCAR